MQNNKLKEYNDVFYDINITSLFQQRLRLKCHGFVNNCDIPHLIYKARIIKGYNVTETARLCNLSYDNYIKYEKGKVKYQYMDLKTLDKISKVLDVDLISSSDYLKFKKDSAEIIKKYMADNKISIRTFAEVLNVSSTTIKQWRNGKCSPSYEIWLNYFKDKI